ncbi:MAG: DUF4405 domain-containing protein [Thiohalospira sp.]
MKAKVNFIIDAIMFVLMGLLAGIGLLIKYVLLSGEERWIKYGQNVDIRFLGLDRHQWGEIHLYIAIMLVLFLVLHIVLHWNMIVCLYEKIICIKTARIMGALTFMAVTILLILFPFLIRVKTSTLATGRERFEALDETKKYKQVNDKISISDVGKVKNAVLATKEKEKKEGLKLKNESSIEIRGFQTFKEVSREYNIPCDYMKQKLGIPLSVSNSAKLGHLRKQYGFKMSELEIIVLNYKK